MKTHKKFLLEANSRTKKGNVEPASLQTPETQSKTITTFEIGGNENLTKLFSHLQEIRKRPVNLIVRIHSRK